MLSRIKYRVRLLSSCSERCCRNSYSNLPPFGASQRIRLALSKNDAWLSNFLIGLQGIVRILRFWSFRASNEGQVDSINHVKCFDFRNRTWAIKDDSGCHFGKSANFHYICCTNFLDDSSKNFVMLPRKMFKNWLSGLLGFSLFCSLVALSAARAMRIIRSLESWEEVSSSNDPMPDSIRCLAVE